MGLDIYFYKTNILPNSNDMVEVHKAYTEKLQNDFKETFHKYFKKLQKAANCDDYTTDENYINAYERLRKSVSKFFDYEWYTKDLDNVCDTKSVKIWYGSHISCVSPIEDIYYRKVNFVYRFFNERSHFESECCWVTKEMAEELVNKCDEVINNKDKASEILPTTSGFFFGSTNYDNWYLDDVKSVRRDFKKLLENWKDDERVYAVFSW